jgi:hypothetical protein
VPSEQYGAIIARIARAAAMTEADWAAIAGQLRLAYRLLKKAVSWPARQD